MWSAIRVPRTRRETPSRNGMPRSLGEDLDPGPGQRWTSRRPEPHLDQNVLRTVIFERPRWGHHARNLATCCPDARRIGCDDATIIPLCPEQPGNTHQSSSTLRFARGSLKSSARTVRRYSMTVGRRFFCQGGRPCHRRQRSRTSRRSGFDGARPAATLEDTCSTCAASATRTGHCSTSRHAKRCLIRNRRSLLHER